MSNYQIDSKRREIQKLKEQNSKHQKDISDRRTKIIRCNDALRRTNNQSTMKNKLREIERYEKDIANFEKKNATNLKKESEYNKQLNNYIKQHDIAKDKAFDEALRKIELQKNITEGKNIAFFSGKEYETKEWDVFLSHASEDKADFASPLANELTSRNVKVWFDQFSLDWGDSLMKK